MVTNYRKQHSMVVRSIVMVPKMFTFLILERSKGASPDPQLGFQPVFIPTAAVMLEDVRVYRKWRETEGGTQ